MIPNELKLLKRWVCADADKIPMKPFIRERASSTNPHSWGTFEQANRCVSKGIYENLGFVFADDGYVGIDIDCGFDDRGDVSNVARDIINRCDSYTELSKSGRGFHIIIKGNIDFNGKNNRSGVEIYKTGRYFVMTGCTYEDRFDIIENQSAIDKIVETYFAPSEVERATKNNTERIYTPIWERTPNGKHFILNPTYPQITEGSRNISLLSLAGSLLDVGYDIDWIYSELIKCNNLACVPPLHENEVLAITKSIYKYSKK